MVRVRREPPSRPSSKSPLEGRDPTPPFPDPEPEPPPAPVPDPGAPPKPPSRLGDRNPTRHTKGNTDVDERLRSLRQRLLDELRSPHSIRRAPHLRLHRMRCPPAGAHL